MKESALDFRSGEDRQLGPIPAVALIERGSQNTSSRRRSITDPGKCGIITWINKCWIYTFFNQCKTYWFRFLSTLMRNSLQHVCCYSWLGVNWHKSNQFLLFRSLSTAKGVGEACGCYGEKVLLGPAHAINQTVSMKRLIPLFREQKENIFEEDCSRENYTVILWFL